MCWQAGGPETSSLETASRGDFQVEVELWTTSVGRWPGNSSRLAGDALVANGDTGWSGTVPLELPGAVLWLHIHIFLGGISKSKNIIYKYN